MNENLYTTKTAALKATIADTRRLNSKKIFLDGKNILDYISDSEFNNYDTRDPELKNDELDIWNTAISLSEEGHIEVKPLEHTWETISSEQKNELRNYAGHIINNEVLTRGNNHEMYWQTEGLTDGSMMFQFNDDLTTFNSDLSSLTNGGSMFDTCLELTTFNSDLSSLTNGGSMFNNCEKLTSFNADLSSLTNGSNMFFMCSTLDSFNCDLSKLTNGWQMFCRCSNLTSFNGDLSSLTNLDLTEGFWGNAMFAGCEKLTSFTSNLSSLKEGDGMFDMCKLNAESVANIVHTLPTHETNAQILIGIGCDNTAEDQLLFAQECDCEDWQELLDDFSDKNWIVTFQCNGRPTSTYNMRRGETLPIYAKLEEITDNKKIRYAKYTSADGSKFYNIRHFHSTNGSTEGYDVFSSLEEAINSYGITPKN